MTTTTLMRPQARHSPHLDRLMAIRPVSPRSDADPRLRGLCVENGDPDLWYSTDERDVELAIAICAACPVLLACRQRADDLGEKWGVWAGVDRSTRQQVQP